MSSYTPEQLNAAIAAVESGNYTPEQLYKVQEAAQQAGSTGNRAHNALQRLGRQ